MERILEVLFPPQLPEIFEPEVLIQQHVHVEFEHVPESGIGEVRPRIYRDAIDRVFTELAHEDIT